ncbi:putative circularly permuted ATP-grasp superfamily protein/putative alpha-E superfamily protein [Pararhizobium capsulatum DSM 1112]|uniref:Circularly permuted ATP-grasp superfamily protein/putative alpha-E superfamily protein n=1 Tax=Pararhizobium capsulatum DSM 1112 TaxID=1121113 RepID=A0ABU0BUC7_9HYPH|nr:circularly permuted type 2 ATP-grasp protein [Pararhizobium capsulatum]MDQ0321856.1 putative circularly permuted ATP-grasp superfamily protein/putative alpha-E superfamily protein [Pararhizobium capsulatum DSM 1112]
MANKQTIEAATQKNRITDDPVFGYRALPGIADEMVDINGNVRPVWQQLLANIGRMDETELSNRFARADRYLRDAGVFYRAYGSKENSERSWPLSHVPVMIDEREWSALSKGLVQRADLLERLASDLYGPNRLVAEGIVPPALVAGNPEFLRPMVGVKPADGHFLHFCSFEIGRGPDGNWWVLSDRTEAPSGAGFALENRVATTRAFSDLYAETHVHRLAGFFGAFRDMLQSRKRHPDDRIAVLSPGLANETYFEHAYIARYLGFMLLEGEDLTVLDDRVMVRTVAGLKPVGVLWRRLDAAFADPLELNQGSHIGTPGLVEALRAGSVTIVNALGSGILETRAFLAFMPVICRQLLGEDLLLPSIATWWCGQQPERDHVAGNIEKMVIGPAYSTRPFFDDNAQSVLGSSLRDTAKLSVADWLKTDGAKLVGQEAVTLSTTPAWINGRLTPRPMSLRVYVARTRDGWQVMPGGFARIGSGADAAAIAMQAGGSAADVWIVSDKPVERTTLLPPEENFIRTMPGSLPSRAADNLFWLGRYIERAEGALRILRAWNGRFAETADSGMPLLKDISTYLAALDIDTKQAVPDSLVANINSALFSASNIRDRFSADGWLALNDLAKTARKFQATVEVGDDATHAMTVLLRKLAGFAGLVHENMYRFTGWRFLSIGRYLERGLHMTRLLGHMSGEDAPDGAYDMLLEIGDSVMTHRRRYNVNTASLTVTDLLALDPLNPRSVLYQLNEIKTEVEQLPNAYGNGQMSSFYREAMRLHAGLAVMTADGMNGTVYKKLEQELERFSDILARTYLG